MNAFITLAAKPAAAIWSTSMPDFSVTRGDSHTLNVAVSTEADPVDLTDKLLTFTARRSYGGAVVFEHSLGSGITVTDAANGLAEVAIAPADTASLPDHSVKLVYDLQMTSGSEVHTIGAGTLTVNPDVTE